MSPGGVPDELDQRILDVLRRDARASYRSIAQEIGSTTPTVSARIRRMEDVGLIAGYRVVVRQREEPEEASAPWTCVHCDGPMHGRARTRKLGERHYAFCCKGCETAFVRRYEAAANS